MADLSLPWAHSHFDGFVMGRLIFRTFTVFFFFFLFFFFFFYVIKTTEFEQNCVKTDLKTDITFLVLL